MISKAYGKILLFGGYSVIEEFNGLGGIGLVLNVNRGTECGITFSESFRMDVPAKGIRAEGKLDEGRLKLSASEDSLAYLRFARNAAQEAIQYLRGKDIKVKPFSLSLRNDAELELETGKTGLGSSATSTVSVISSILAMHGVDPQANRDAVFDMSYRSHNLTQGKIGSGFDVASAVYGSIFFRRPTVKTGMLAEPYMFPDYFRFVIAFTGKPSSTTSLVRQVMAFKEDRPALYSKFMEGYNKTNEMIYAHLKDMPAQPSDSFSSQLSSLLQESWKERRELGERAGALIETPEHTAIIDGAVSHGALCAGLPGAGGGDSIVALCKDDEARDAVSQYFKSRGLITLDKTGVGNFPFRISKI